ncbi:hypothetical protein [Sinomonas flava]
MPDERGTNDRRLAAAWSRMVRRGQSHTKPRFLLKAPVPVRT